ncbi:hypothetical protein [Mameliella alba]|uniref:hypothetical protein n=1 Tax=Mameliella alba TaxID=561184 RepID=UPI000B52CBC1|nr:hypothetical protein [Mameliella alba]OWV40780.1 hypothetical protein CDZ95_20485 [Mameliella alba]BBU55279.1 hypothetical protein KU6B_15440 [Mameliella alba]
MIHFEKYTAQEAATITGMTLTAQRDHRRRFPSFIPPQGRHPTYEFFELLQMRFVMDVASLGIGPKRAWEQSEWAAVGAAYSALHLPGCVDGFLPIEEVPGLPLDEEIRTEETARGVFQEIMNEADMPNVVPERFVFIWDKGDAWFDKSFDAWRQQADPNDPRLGKPAVILDLPYFARTIVKKLPRPAVRIIDEDQE